MGTSVGTVKVDLDANSYKLFKELKKSERQTRRTAQRMQRSMSKAFRSIKTAALTLGASLGLMFSAQMIRQQLAYAGNLQRVADTVGFTSEQVQELRYAAGQLNLDQRTLDMSLQRFSRRMGEAAANTGEALKVVKQYGIEVKDSAGNVRDNIDILRDWAKVISEVEDEQEQLRLAFKLFDSEGAPLVRLLKQGEAGLDAFAMAAREAGVVMGDELVANAAEADRVFNQMKQTVDAKLAAAVAQNADELARFAESIGEVVSAAIDGVEHVRTFFGIIKGGIEGLNAFADRVLDEEQADKIQAAFDAYSEAREKLERVQGLSTSNPDTQAGIDRKIAIAQAEVDRLRANWLRLREVAQETHRQNIQNNVEAANSAAEAAAETVAVVTQAKQELAELSIESNLDRILRPEVTEDIENAKRTTEEYFAELRKGAETVDEVNAMAQEMGFTFQSAFEDAIIEGEKFSKVLQGLIKDIARMMLRSAITAPLGNFFGGLFGGGKAEGGQVMGGRSYLVGEQGPELFTPGATGFITPNHAMAGAGPSISYTIDARGADEAAVISRMIPLLEQTVQLTKNEIARDRAEGRIR